MDILLVLVGVLLGIGVTLGAQTARVWYLDWRRARDWAIAGRRWREILDHINKKTNQWGNLSAEERFANLQSRVHMIITGEPIDDFDEQIAYIKDHPERLPEHELEKHRERAEARERAYVTTPGFSDSKDKTPPANPLAKVGNASRT